MGKMEKEIRKRNMIHFAGGFGGVSRFINLGMILSNLSLWLLTDLRDTIKTASYSFIGHHRISISAATLLMGDVLAPRAGKVPFAGKSAF